MMHKTLIWQHVKRGGLYAIVAHPELQSSGGPISEGAELTIYVGLDDGKQWARPRAEFEDGRFVPVPPLALADLAAAARNLVMAAERCGMVLTIEQRPRTPLAMGNYYTEVSLRPARGQAAPAEVSGG